MCVEMQILYTARLPICSSSSGLQQQANGLSTNKAHCCSLNFPMAAMSASVAHAHRFALFFQGPRMINGLLWCVPMSQDTQNYMTRYPYPFRLHSTAKQVCSPAHERTCIVTYMRARIRYTCTHARHPLGAPTACCWRHWWSPCCFPLPLQVPRARH